MRFHSNYFGLGEDLQNNMLLKFDVLDEGHKTIRPTHLLKNNN